jgi:hypothetical protein
MVSENIYHEIYGLDMAGTYGMPPGSLQANNNSYEHGRET